MNDLENLINIARNVRMYTGYNKTWGERQDELARLQHRMQNRLDAADALAEKAEQLLGVLPSGWAHGGACIALDAALREFKSTWGNPKCFGRGSRCLFEG